MTICKDVFLHGLFFHLGNFVEESITHLNVSAKKKEENVGSKTLVVFMGRATQRYDSCGLS